MAPIHCRGTICEVIPKFLQICSDEETNSSTSWMAWGWVKCTAKKNNWDEPFLIINIIIMIVCWDTDLTIEMQLGKETLEVSGCVGKGKMCKWIVIWSVDGLARLTQWLHKHCQITFLKVKCICDCFPNARRKWMKGRDFFSQWVPQ